MATPETHKQWYKDEKRRLDAITDVETFTKELNDKFALANTNCDKDDSATKFNVAYNYQIVAEYYADNKISLPNLSCHQLFHFAAHQFRFLENFKIAAELYEKAGDYALVEAETTLTSIKLSTATTEEKKTILKSFEWAIRSFARAKVSFNDIGDSDEANDAYLKEQKARTLNYKFLNEKSKYYWNLIRKSITNYGESTKNWLKWLLIIIGIFDIIYCSMQLIFKIPNEFSWHSFLDGAFLYIGTTLGFGEIFTAAWQLKIVYLFNLITGYLMLALGIDIIMRKFKNA